MDVSFLYTAFEDSLEKSWTFLSRRKKYVLIALLFPIVFLLFDLLFPFSVGVEYSQTVSDRRGNLLHAFLTSDDKWRMKAEGHEISPELRKAFLYKEDRWFDYHFGVNFFSVARAFSNNLLRGRRTSGASTITMQTVRLLQPRQRTYFNKLLEMFRAFQLEWHLSKEEILLLYLNLVPYGGNVEGVKSASVLFFGKMPEHLSLAEVAALVVVPNRPTSLRLGLDNVAVSKVRDEWLHRFEKARLFPAADLSDALGEPLAIQRRESPKTVPHLSYRLKKQYPDVPNIRSCIDPDKQKNAEQLVSNYIRRLYGQRIRNAAAIVIDNRSREVLAYIGSADFYNRDDAGQVDGIAALRSPGSALKPFLAAAAFDRGICTPEMKISDVPVNFGGYSPENYDKTYNGMVSLRFALSNSLNVPFVKLLNQYGVGDFAKLLSEAGFGAFRDPLRKHGLSLILGGCGVRLEEMSNLYATFANGGVYRQLAWVMPSPVLGEQLGEVGGTHLVSREAAYVVSDILGELMRPDLPKNVDNAKNIPRIAWKTGTSYGRRDAWSIGYNAHYTVGVWVGNFSGEGVPDLNGTQTATPLLFDLFTAIDDGSSADWFAPPEGLAYRWICSETGLLPQDFCTNQIMDIYLPGVSHNRLCTHLREVAVSPDESWSYCTACMPVEGFRRETYPAYPSELLAYYEKEGINYERVPPHNPRCERVFGGNAPVISSPVHNLDYLIDRQDNDQIMLSCQTSGEVGTVYWYVDDRFLGEALPNVPLFFVPKEGLNKIVCVDDKGRKSEVLIKVRFL